jgi:hypothetical protein
VSLVNVEISNNDSVLPDEFVTFLREADLRVSQFIENSPLRATGFVPSDFEMVYHALQSITDAKLAPGTSLCEWGSGFGVVASLASMLEFMACGIEIEKDLVDASRRLADDFGLPVQFVQGSFIPSGAESCAEDAYPWPGEEYLITSLFEKYAAEGALLLTYNYLDSVRLRRKLSGKYRGS